MRSLIFISVFIFCYTAGKAQYNLQVTPNKTYTDIGSGDFEIPDTSQFWGNIIIRPNFSFNAFGSSYDFNSQPIYIPIKQGYMYFINDTNSTTIYGSRGDFVARPGQNQTSVFSYVATGLGGERGLILQWKNVGLANGDSSDFLNFQIWLYEKSGGIEIRFGDVNVKSNLWENNANGPIIGLLEMDKNFSNIFNRVWLTGDAQSPVETKTGTFLALNNTPKKGMSYLFTPVITSVKEVTLNKYGVKVYPTVITYNSAVTISNTANIKKLTAKLYNTLGQLIKEEVILSDNHKMQLPEMKEGVYILSYEKEGKVIGKTKLIK